MGAKTSAEMVRAKALVLEQGATAYQAAHATGLTTGAISRTKWYREHLAAQPPPLDESPAMARARHLVVRQGMTAYAAAQAVGIAQSTISRAQWYREHIENLLDKLES